jgi:hypothetical protein
MPSSLKCIFMSTDSSSCLVFGGHHYATFDRQFITYRGVCKHLLVGTNQFQVFLRNGGDERAQQVPDGHSATNTTRNTSVPSIRYVEVSTCGNIIRVSRDAKSAALVPVKVRSYSVN